jgi:hypothetical protein
MAPMGVGYSEKVGLDESRPRAGPGGCRKHEAGPVITIVYRNPCRSALREKRTLNAPAQSQGPSTGAVKRAGPRRARTGAGVRAGGQEGVGGSAARGKGSAFSLLSFSPSPHPRRTFRRSPAILCKLFVPLLHCPEKCVIVCLFGTYSRHPALL